MTIPMAPPIASIPPSDTAVEVSIIDTKSNVKNVPVSVCAEPRVGQHKLLDCPCFAFLIHHKPSGRRLVYDLGIRKDWDTGYTPWTIKSLKSSRWDITAPTDVAEILKSNGVSLDSINAIIWSHHHWDHIGDPNTFPESTSIIVGPGFKKEFFPGYPKDPEASISIDSIGNREIAELDFTSNPLTIGPYPAIDYFNDGSFYLLDTPGHTIGHISALARTTPSVNGPNDDDSTFIFMGGDIAHHCGEFRPSPQLPMPDSIFPNPLQPVFNPTSSFCPCSIFTSLHPLHQSQTQSHSTPTSTPQTSPFYTTTGATDIALAQKTIDVLPRLDGNPNILTVLAHDTSLIEVVRFFPESANGWREAGWRKEGVWRFLADFVGKDEIGT